MYNPYSLEGKTILVTGASSGIGRQTVIEASRLGARIIASARDKERLEETLSMLEGSGHSFIIADLSIDEQVEDLASQVEPLDGFSCNAGIPGGQLVLFYKEEQIENVFKVNTFSAMMLTRHLLKKKKLKRGASVVYTSSAGNVFCAAIANGIYGASKCALDGFMRSAAIELAAKGIRCNSVNPSVVMTAFQKNSGITQEQYQKELANYPLGRFGTPVDVALAICFLLSDASSFITGTAVKIDGGSTL
ncbi:MAG: SDR family oxidoreductase [Bacteroidales bacterium]|nr:SDR family oxidoreductase [Bacteroidales bacterium]